MGDHEKKTYICCMSSVGRDQGGIISLHGRTIQRYFITFEIIKD